jgi:hypothetical protein
MLIHGTFVEFNCFLFELCAIIQQFWQGNNFKAQLLQI